MNHRGWEERDRIGNADDATTGPLVRSVPSHGLELFDELSLGHHADLGSRRRE